MSKDTHADQDLGNGQRVELDEIDPSNEVILEGEDQIRSQLIGTTRFYTFKSSNVLRIKDTRTENAENLEHEPNTTSM